MPYSLKGKNVLVTGGSRGLGALICEKFAAEGANVAVNYVEAADRAKEVAAKIEKEYSVKSIIVQGDAGIAEDNVKLVKAVVEAFGGIDIVIANAGWTRFSNFGDLNALSHAEWDKCWRTNVMAHLQLMQEVAPIFNKNEQGGVYLISSSIAGLATGGSSMAYAVTKSAGLHLMKCMAASQGPKIRINAICPGLLLTEWGLKYPKEAIATLRDRAALKQETMLDDCAEAYVSTAKNASLTGQAIVIDSGLTVKWS